MKLFATIAFTKRQDERSSLDSSVSIRVNLWLNVDRFFKLILRVTACRASKKSLIDAGELGADWSIPAASQCGDRLGLWIQHRSRRRLTVAIVTNTQAEHY